MHKSTRWYDGNRVNFFIRHSLTYQRKCVPADCIVSQRVNDFPDKSWIIFHTGGGREKQDDTGIFPRLSRAFLWPRLNRVPVLLFRLSLVTRTYRANTRYNNADFDLQTLEGTRADHFYGDTSDLWTSLNEQCHDLLSDI